MTEIPEHLLRRAEAAKKKHGDRTGKVFTPPPSIRGLEAFRAGQDQGPSMEDRMKKLELGVEEAVKALNDGLLKLEARSAQNIQNGKPTSISDRLRQLFTWR